MASYPYGDAFIIGTPKTDRALNMLYQEQKQREAVRDAENKQLEQSMSKEFANVKSADVPKVVELYNDWKEKRKKVLFDKDIQKDALKYNAANTEAKNSLSNLYSLINASKTSVKDMEDMRKSWQTHPELYDDNFGSLYSSYLQTPTSQLSKVQTGKDATGLPTYMDLSNPDNFRHNDPNYNPVKDLSLARGGDKRLYKQLPIGVSPDDPLKDRSAVYGMFPNSAEMFRQNFVSSMGDRAAKKYWMNQYAQTPASEIQKVNDEYNSFDNELLKKLGIKKPDLKVTNADNIVDQIATYNAQKYFMENLPQFIKNDDKVNEARRLKQQQDFAAEQQKLREKGANSRAHSRANTVAGNQYIPQAHVDAIFEDGATDVMEINVNKKPIAGRKVVLPDEIKEKFARKLGTHSTLPDYFYMSNDKKDVYPVFVVKKMRSGNDIIDVKPGERISVESSLVPMLSKAFGGQSFTKKTIYTKPSTPTKKDPLGLGL